MKFISASLCRILAVIAIVWTFPGAYGSDYGQLPFDMQEVATPSIPEYTVSLTDFGGTGDGHHDNTEAFQMAFAHLREKGGGHLNVEPGIWLTGPIALESNTDLHLEHGAILLFSDNRDDYPLFRWDVADNPARECVSPISAFDKHDISITGHGTINGRGEIWRPVKKMKLTDNQWKKLCGGGTLSDDGRIWYPSESIKECTHEKIGGAAPDDDRAWESMREFLRPVMVLPVRCERVLFEGVTFENSPRWNVRPLLCRDVTLRNVTIRNPAYAQNGDGLDIESCSNVHVTGCTFDVGDDAICIKSGKDRAGRMRGASTSSVLIEECKVYSGHGGFVIGSEMSGGVYDVAVRNCLFIGTDTGIKFKSTRGRGGAVRGIHISDIKMVGIAGDAITADLYYGRKAAGQHAEPVDESTPVFAGISISGISCTGAARAIWLNGLPEMPIRNISISNSIISAEAGAIINNADSVTLHNVTINHSTGSRLTVTKTANLTDR